MGENFWTEEKISTLKKLVEEGRTFLQIGNTLGCSKNAALGKARRIGVQSAYATGAGRKRVLKPPLVVKPRKPKATVAPETPETAAEVPVSPPPHWLFGPERPTEYTLPSGRWRVRLPFELWHADAFELRILEIVTKVPQRNILHIPHWNECKWIIGDPKGDGYWCRMDTRGHRNYCDSHSRLAYEKPPKRTGKPFKFPVVPQLRKAP